MKINAIYPGTFDPITFGHIDVIKKALKIVDTVIVAISETDNKNYFFVEINTSSPSLTGNEEETFPFLTELTIPIIPFPPLFVTLNS